jgi:Mg2+ and Co2+ transporter CorA
MPQPAWVMYAILDCIIDSYIPIVSGLASESGLLDQLALTLSPDDQQDFLTRIRMERSKLARVRTTLLVKGEILSQLTARGYVSFLDDLTKVSRSRSRSSPRSFSSCLLIDICLL